GTAMTERLRHGTARLRAFTSTLAADEHVFLRREAPALFRYDADDTLLTPVEREQERVRGENVIDSVMSLTARRSLPELAVAARAFDDVLECLLAAAHADAGRGGFTELRALLQALQRDDVPVIFGTPGDDVHRLDALLAPQRSGIVFDPGGNDRYVLSGLAQPGAWLIVLD